MPTLIVVPFAVFFACCAGQFWFVAQVRNALIDRHSELFLEIERSSAFPNRGLSKFIRSSQHKDLQDPQLTSAVMRCRYLYLTAIVAWLLFAAIMVFGLEHA